MSCEVLIVGAGLAGLCCARRLQQQGVTFQLLDASDGVGGRIRTDIVEGFRLDRGFQVLLTSYPEAREVLDLKRLQLRSFQPGALVRRGGRFHSMIDPWRRPLAALGSVWSPVGSLVDKLRIARFRSMSLRGSIAEHFQQPEVTTFERLKTFGFSPSIIDRFFRPFLGGIFLDPELETSSRMLDFVFRMFSIGDATLPTDGMESIPRQIAAGLRQDSVRLNSKVVSLRQQEVELSTGEVLKAKAIVVATEGPAAARLLGSSINTRGQGVTCFYFSAPRPPIDRPMLVLNGEGHGPINNLCVPTSVAPSYGPKGKSLVSVTVLGIHPAEQQLIQPVCAQLKEWFGPIVDEWQHLRTYSIPYALPNQTPPALEPAERSVHWQQGIYVCGDHRDNASIQGAMVSGRRAAEAVLKDLA